MRLKLKKPPGSGPVFAGNGILQSLPNGTSLRGGFYIWLRLKGKVPVDQLFQNMLKEQILINPGTVYDFGKNQAIRLSYAYAGEEELKKGIKKLAAAIRDLQQG